MWQICESLRDFLHNMLHLVLETHTVLSREIQLLLFGFPWAIFILLVLAFQIYVTILSKWNVVCLASQSAIFTCLLSSRTVKFLVIVYVFFLFTECLSLFFFWCLELDYFQLSIIKQKRLELVTKSILSLWCWVFLKTTASLYSDSLLLNVLLHLMHCGTK